MPKVIIVSNRLPIAVDKVDGKLVYTKSVGGLASGVSTYASSSNSQWIGWPGIASDDLSEKDKQAIVAELSKQNYSPVFLTQRQLDSYYNGYSNSVLWPLFHDLKVKIPTPEAWWKAYREVNQLFVETINSLAPPDAAVWIHDYLLLLAPEMLRNSGHSGQIGFFLHTPFPDYARCKQVKEIKSLINGMLGADLIGFHTNSYGDNFQGVCQELEIGVVSQKQIILPRTGRTVLVTDFPLGIDYRKYADAGKLKSVKAAIKKYRKRYGRRQIIVAVDRLEPAKGLEERVRAYRDFLEISPRLRGKIVLVMVAAPSRMQISSYQQLQRRLHKLVKDVNKQYGTAKWQPIDLINQPLPFEEVTALYRIADIAFIAPLRDGMNLVAKEYVASKKRSGVLILSETAGAAEELRDALLVNPLRAGSSTAALQQAINMPKRELRRRLKTMQHQLLLNNPNTWAGTFVTTLQRPIPGNLSVVRSLKGKAYEQLISDFKVSRRRLLLLDYDGSLVPFRLDFAAASPPPKLLKLIGRLKSDPRNEVVIVSGRGIQDLDNWFGDLKLNMIAEHGALSKKANNQRWQSLVKSETTWIDVLQPILEKYAVLAPGARVEVKGRSLVWHYRNVKPFYAQKYAVVVKKEVKPLLKRYGLQLLQGNKVIEIKDPRINKSIATQTLVDSYQTDFILSVGDDRTDEDLFASLGSTAYTIKVGPGRSLARYRLAAPSDVQELLDRLTR